MGYFEFENNETALNEINLMAMQKAIAELLLPIGSTYITQEDINPSTILGFGTWERSKGKVFVGLDEDDADFNEIGKTGGEKTHTLTVDEMAKHDHYLASEKEGTEDYYPYIGTYSSSNNSDKPYSLRGQEELAPNRFLSSSKGGNQPHNNLQPYEVVGYMWIRRA